MKKSAINFGFLVLRACVLGLVMYCAFNPSAQLLNLISVWFWLITIMGFLGVFVFLSIAIKVEGMNQAELDKVKSENIPNKMFITKAIGITCDVASLIGIAMCGFFWLTIALSVSEFLVFCFTSGLRGKVKKREVELNSPSKSEWA